MCNLGASCRKIWQRVVKWGQAMKGRHPQASLKFVQQGKRQVWQKWDKERGAAHQAASALGGNWVGNLGSSKKLLKKIIHQPAGASRVSLTDSSANLERQCFLQHVWKLVSRYCLPEEPHHLIISKRSKILRWWRGLILGTYLHNDHHGPDMIMGGPAQVTPATGT